MERIFKPSFSDRQHPFHARHCAVLVRRFLEAFKGCYGERQVLDGHRIHLTSKRSSLRVTGKSYEIETYKLYGGVELWEYLRNRRTGECVE